MMSGSEGGADEAHALQHALVHMETQRAVLGDAVVDTAIGTLREKLAALRAQAATEERRQVTILFADLAGFTSIAEAMDPEDVGEMQASFFKACREVVERHGGVVEKFIGDAVVAVFGIPAARETDPSNAVLTGLELQRTMSALNQDWGWNEDGTRSERRAPKEHASCCVPAPLRLRIGINTGLVAVSFNSNRADGFAVAGDAVNTASRIQTSAPPGGVLIAHVTYRHVRGMFEARAMEPLSVKGKSEPLRTYLVVGLRSSTTARPARCVEDVETPMVGRENELDVLQRAYGHAMGGPEARSALILGEAGIGKSRLLFEFERWRQSQAPVALCVRGRASPELTTTPYGLLRDLLRAHFSITESDAVAEVQRKFERHTAAYLSTEQAHVTGHLLGFDFSTAPGVRHLLDSATFAQTALSHLWVYFRDLSRDTPLVILLEDLHWADLPSLEFIARITSDLPHSRLLLIGTARPALFERVPSWRQDGLPGFMHVALSPLTPSQSQTLVADILLHVDDLPTSLCEQIVGHAEGNPFYLEEIIKMLIDDGVIIRGRERWSVQSDRLQGLRVPTTLTGVLQARFDGLSPDERVLLQRAAVVGRYFWDGSIRAMQDAGEEQIDIEACLCEVQSKNLVFPHCPSRFCDAGEYLFKHAVLREVVYETVLLRSRRIYHQHAALWLERQTGERTREFAALIADHYEKAGSATCAAEWLKRAADAAVQSADLRQAISDAERALELLARGAAAADTPQKKAALQILLGEARMKLSEFTDARGHLEEGLNLVGSHGELAARALSLLCRIACLCGDIAEARCLGERGVVLARGTEDPSTIRNALYAMGYVLFFMGDYAGVARCGQECLELSHGSHDEYHMARAYTLLGNAALNTADYPAAERYYLEGIRLAEAAGAPFETATCRANLGNVYMAQGDYHAALRCYEADYEFACRVGDRWSAAIDMANVGQAHCRLGDRATALSCYARACEEALAVDAVWVALSTLAGKAEIVMGEGDSIGAAELLGLALRHPRSNAEVAHDAEGVMAALRERLTPEALEEAMARGAQMNIQDVMPATLNRTARSEAEAQPRPESATQR
ncbi:AAA family ATPase [Candidatus Fermentibacteria bacterium]|nr:AAA family ATPase [Candidatus Fermentibacteria bacterium]